MRLMIALMLTALLIPSPALSAELNEEQRAWIDALVQDPERMNTLMKAEEAQMRAQHWKTVTNVQVTDLVLASAVQNLEPTALNAPQISLGQTMYIWLALETPKQMQEPQDIKVFWYHESESTPARMNTVTIDQASPHWRTWDQWRMRKAGSWTIVIMHGDRELRTTTFVVH